MLIFTFLASLLVTTPTFAAPGGSDRWIDTQMAALGAVFETHGRRMTVEQEAMARVIFEAASAHGNTPDQGTFALWITTRPLRGNTALMEGIAKVLWPHKSHDHHLLAEYARAPAAPRRWNTLGAILIIDDEGEGILGMLEAFRLRNKVAEVVDAEHSYGVVIVIDAHDMVLKHGARFPRHFQVVDVGRAIDDCQRPLIDVPSAPDDLEGLVIAHAL